MHTSLGTPASPAKVVCPPIHQRVSHHQKDEQERGTVDDSDSRAERGRQPWGLGLVPLMRSGNEPS